MVLVQSLHTAVDRELGLSSTKRALLSVPNFSRLFHEDLQDAMDYIDFTMVSTHKHIRDKNSDISPAFAGSYHGLCEQHEDIDACEDEEAAMPVSYILALSLSQTSFSAGYTYMQAAYRSILEKEATRFDLGLQNLPPGGEQCQKEKTTYWARICDMIIEVGPASSETFDTLILLDEDTDNLENIRTVQEALRVILLDHSPQDISLTVVSEKQKARSSHSTWPREGCRIC